MLPAAMLEGPLSPDDLQLLRMHSRLARTVGHANVPPRRSYLWRLLWRCFGRRVAVVSVTLAGVEELAEVDAALNFCRFEAATIVAAHLFTAEAPVPPSGPHAKVFFGGEQIDDAAGTLFGLPIKTTAAVAEAERAGLVYSADAIKELLLLAKPIAWKNEVWFGSTLPADWHVPTPQPPRA